MIFYYVEKTHYRDLIKSFKSQFLILWFKYFYYTLLKPNYFVQIWKNHPHKKYLLIPPLNFLFIKGIIKFFFSFASISSFIKNIIGMFSTRFYCCCFSIFFMTLERLNHHAHLIMEHEFQGWKIMSFLFIFS